jgi:uncharacterized protein
MEDPLIISNTTPLINFAEIGRMDLLGSLYGVVTITPSVVDELGAKSSLFPLAARVPSMNGIAVVDPADRLLVRGFAAQVHPGEAECLALAMEHPESLLLLDDLGARELAEANQLRFTGTLGCLIELRRRGFVPAIRPLLHDLRVKARFWISPALETRVLQNCGEA